MSDIITRSKLVVGSPFFFEGVIVFISALIVLRLFSEIALALRAKRRARYLVQAARQREEFQELVRRAYQDLASHEAYMDELRLNVERQISAMSESDRRMVHQGLHQRNRRGSDRYLKEIVGDQIREVA